MKNPSRLFGNILPTIQRAGIWTVKTQTGIQQGAAILCLTSQ